MVLLPNTDRFTRPAQVIATHVGPWAGLGHPSDLDSKVQEGVVTLVMVGGLTAWIAKESLRTLLALARTGARADSKSQRSCGVAARSRPIRSSGRVKGA